MGLVARQLPDNLWAGVMMDFKGQVRPFGEAYQMASKQPTGTVYATPKLPIDDRNSLVLDIFDGDTGFTIGGEYVRLGDRPDMIGESKRAARAFDKFIRSNPGIYVNTPITTDGFGDSRARFYEKRGFTNSAQKLMVLDSRIYAPVQDQQVYAHLNKLIPSGVPPFLTSLSRKNLVGSKVDPWLLIPEPTLYDSGGARLDIPSGAFGTIARAAIRYPGSKPRQAQNNQDLVELITRPMSSQDNRHLAELLGRPVFSQGNQDIIDVIPF